MMTNVPPIYHTELTTPCYNPSTSHIQLRPQPASALVHPVDGGPEVEGVHVAGRAVHEPPGVPLLPHRQPEGLKDKNIN